MVFPLDPALPGKNGENPGRLGAIRLKITMDGTQALNRKDNRAMARQSKHTGAFAMGLLLGGAAAAAAAIWNSPQAGEKTRQQITEKVEQVLFTVLGAGEATMARVLTPESPAPAVPEPVSPINHASLTQ
jgi:hypothetical protein